ncbi:MAG: D-Ala-D-Ala carboxypeptidase family metallohydrolase [Pseudomonadota bacterium]|nr:D-Ala-D-Ala carboxypeptidase family metallohydrolase [Pseudomonadota bacterium]
MTIEDVAGLPARERSLGLRSETARKPFRTGLAASLRGLRAAPLAAASLLPLLAGCMSSMSDVTAFGFAPSGSVSANAAPLDVSNAPEVDVSRLGDIGADSQSEKTIPAVSEEEVREVARAAEEGNAHVGGQGARPLIVASARREGLAAYAGGSVGEGGSASGATGSGGSLFASLFARQEARTPIANGEKGKGRRVILRHDGAPQSASGDALPGVDPRSLFEIGQRNSANEEDAIEDASYQMASLGGGFARMSPNGLRVARESVRTDCFPRELVGMIRAIESRFGQKVVVTSGYRSPEHNRRVRGAKRSQHMACKAADIVIPNVDNLKVAAFVRALPGRGGVGTYCHTQAIHVDVGPKRDWNWRCRRRR